MKIILRENAKKVLTYAKRVIYTVIRDCANRVTEVNELEVGKAIRNIRKSRGITATFMAKKLGYKSVSSYTRLEKGEATITLEQAKRIADLLMVDLNEFFCDQNLRETRNPACSENQPTHTQAG